MKIDGLSLELTSTIPTIVDIDEILNKDFSAIGNPLYSSIFHVPYNFNIRGYNKKSEIENILVGTIEGTSIISTWIDDWEDEDTAYEFNKISDENVELHKLICKNIRKLKYILNEDFYYISRLEIKKQYRNHGIGSCVFPLIIETFNRYFKIGLSCIILKAFPLEYMGKYDEDNPMINKEIEIAEKRLFDFYKRVGFKKIDRNYSFMAYRYKNNEVVTNS